MRIADANQAAAAGIYQQSKAPFFDTIKGATSKESLVRDEDVQVHGFESIESANAYLQSEVFSSDVVGGLAPLLDAALDIRIYQAA